MRKFILIAAMVLVSATAQAAGVRSLTLASSEEPASAEPAKSAAAPKYVERPPAIDTAAEPARTEETRPAGTKKVERPRRPRVSIEARVIYELHRHGIYW